MNWDEIEADMDAIREENEVSLAIRRGATTLAAQSMRIEIAGARAMSLMSEAARQAEQPVYILGKKDMDIAINDRMNYGDVLLRVVFVQPNRQACTIAEAVVIQ